MRFPVPERNEVTKRIDPSVWPDIYCVLYEVSALSLLGRLEALEKSTKESPPWTRGVPDTFKR